MTKTRLLLSLLCAFVTTTLSAQLTSIEGLVKAKGDVSGIHVINKTSSRYTVTNDNGAFEIPVKTDDTIVFSSVQYKRTEVIITKGELDNGFLVVELEEQINALDEVIVGKVLTGDLESDLQNSEVEDKINFYDLGIPGYTGPKKTQNERRLYEADAGKYVYFYGLVASINIHKILNGISGRTKRLKHLVRLEAQDKCMHKTKSEFSEILFEDGQFPPELITEFFYYVSEDKEFLDVCKLNNSMKMYDFLVAKLLSYNNNLKTSND